MAEVTANGARFHVQELVPPAGVARTGETVVFIHGLVMDNLSSFYYTLANPCAAAGAEVLLYDLRGHGRSERTPAGYTLPDAVADLAGLLEVMAIDGPVHLIGNSYGGTVAVAFALAHPEQVASLVLIEAHFAVEGWGEQMARTLSYVAFGMEIEEAQAFVAAGGRKMSRMAQKSDLLIKETSLVEDLLTAIPLPRKSLQAMTCPVLAVYGDESDAIDRARELGRLIGDFTLHVLDRCGHSILMDAPDHLRKVIGWWLADRHAAPPVFYPAEEVLVA